MKRFKFSFVTVIALLTLILAACGGTQTAQPTTAAEQPTTAAEQPTVAATAVPQPTAATGTETGTMLPIQGTVTLWHAYSTGGAEEQAITQLIDKARAAYPEADIQVLQVPFDQVYNKFQTDVSAGGGPDLYIAPDDNLGSQVRSGLLADLSEYQSMLTEASPLGIEAMTIDGKLYGIPESFKAVALYYNKSKVANPPKTTDELLELVRGGNTLVLNQNEYHNFGWLQAFGGQLMDETGRCVADQQGGTEWFTFLKTLKAEPNVTFSTDGGQANSLFQEGRADMIINGPWELGNYRTALGENLGVAPMPGATQPAGPLTGVDGFYVSVNSQNVPGAVALALFLTNAESMQTYVDVAGHVPVNTKVAISDELVQGFADAAANGVPRPQIPELNNYWGNFSNAITRLLDGDGDPATEIAAACQGMNEANGK